MLLGMGIRECRYSQQRLDMLVIKKVTTSHSKGNKLYYNYVKHHFECFMIIDIISLCEIKRQSKRKISCFPIEDKISFALTDYNKYLLDFLTPRNLTTPACSLRKMEKENNMILGSQGYYHFIPYRAR